MHVMGFGSTDVGRVRRRNEDAFHVDDALGVYIVSDGMGGHAAGDVASRMAIEAALGALEPYSRLIRGAQSGAADLALFSRTLQQIVQTANRAVYMASLSNTELQGMGATLTVLLILGRHAMMAHVGDSRLYLCRGGDVHLLSTDHTMAYDAARLGLITFEDVHEHPFSNELTRAIGTQASVEVDTLAFGLAPGDRLLLCSDGLSCYVPRHADLRGPMTGPLADIPSALIELANEEGGRDNVTAIALEVFARDNAPDSTLKHVICKQILSGNDVLSEVFLFQDLRPSYIEQLLNIATIQEVTEGDALVEPGVCLSALFVVLEGEMGLLRAGQTLQTLTRGDHTGATTWFHGRVVDIELVALRESTVLRIDRAPLMQLLHARPWLGMAVFERLSQHLSLRLEQRRCG